VWVLQLLLSAVWIPTALPFIVVVSGPQLIAAFWALAPWRRRVVRYLPPILIGVWTLWWNAAILLEGSTGPPIQSGGEVDPQLLYASLGGLILIEAVTSIVAAVLLGWAWWVGRRAAADAPAS
jgi:hypothetical protein